MRCIDQRTVDTNEPEGTCMDTSQETVRMCVLTCHSGLIRSIQLHGHREGCPESRRIYLRVDDMHPFPAITNIVSDGLCRRRYGIRHQRCYVVTSPCVLSIHGEKGPVKTCRELRFPRVHAGKPERYSREYDRKSRSDRRRAS